MNRRELLKSMAPAIVMRPYTSKLFQRQESLMPGTPSVKAIVFDTFGTVVDWRGSIIQEGAAWGKARGLQVDWGRFADRWRAGYAPSMDRVRRGELPWTKLDDLHRAILEELLKEFRIDG